MKDLPIHVITVPRPTGGGSFAEASLANVPGGSLAIRGAWLFILCALLLPLVAERAMAISARQELDARQTVVIANQNIPASIELAEYYLKARGIPTNHLCRLDLPAGETMTRWHYENKLREPLQAFLREQGLAEQVRRTEEQVGAYDNPWRTIRSNVRFIVSVRGVPLRIAETRPFLLAKLSRLIEDSFQRDGAAVDSELAILLWGSYELKGYQANPHYNTVHWPTSDRQLRPVVIAARLDGPDPDTVRRMIDDALFAEAHGLHGRCYIDYRSIRDPDYILGDFWLREAGLRFQRLGFDVTYEPHETLFADYFPMEDAAIYLGWYAEHVIGPFRQKAFRFRRGAIAYHLHSGSAKTLRDAQKHWAAPLLSAGAAAVMGAVDEPFLSLTPDLQVFADRIASGYSFGESAYMAQRALSWQITVVGDPLYRPFAISADERIRQLETEGHPDLAWEQVRRVNQLVDQHQFNIGLEYGRAVLRMGDSPMVREKLAELYAKNQLWADSFREYQAVLNQAATDLTAMRVGYRLILMLRMLNRKEAAAEIERELRTAWPNSRYLRYLDEAKP
jgi:uncharacterized protein (TIGR03790 family)